MQRLAIVLAACAVGACATGGPTGDLPDRTDVLSDARAAPPPGT